MKRLELIDHIETISYSLKSSYLSNYIYENKKTISAFCLSSKTGYDQLQVKTKEIADKIFSASSYYNDTNFDTILTEIHNISSSASKINASPHPTFVAFVNLHNTIQKTLQALKESLTSHQELSLPNNRIDTKGIQNTSLFVITIQSEKNIAFENFNEIVSLLGILIRDLSSFQEEKTEPKISFIDLGSDIDIFLDLGKIIAPMLVPLFKMIWDSIANKDKDTEKLAKDIELLLKTQQAIEKGLLTPENADIIIKRCQDNIEKMIKKGVLPKQILDSKNNTSNAELLQKITEPKQLQ